MNTLIVTLLVACIVLLIVVQGVARHRRLSNRDREAGGQSALPRSTWIVFAVAAAFFLFAIFVFPLLLKR